ncbi:unc-50 family protein [Phytophthora cinnamomi]|uniref:unc-50 family protein n=1 Tax=Phytophthora cinnamomi TaxID=4785 RepID=UPI00355A6FCD|nr:unc-50 family protein [Phytophthora cinnamomi]
MLSPMTPSSEGLLQPSSTSTSIDMKYVLSSSDSRHKKKSRRGGADVFRSCSAFPEYFARVLDYRQMDLDATFYQMVTLCVQPAKVYKSAYYRKQTKNRWARDDPAFAVIQFAFLLVATVAWAIAFRVDSAAKYASLLFHAVVVEWLGFGLVISTLCWWIANHHLRQRNSHGMGDALYVEQRVEWQFAFDIHCNSFFIMFLFLYVLQFLLAPMLASDSFLSLLAGNLLYSLGWGSTCTSRSSDTWRFPSCTGRSSCCCRSS